MSQPKIPPTPMPGRSALQMPTPLVNVTLSPEVFEQFIASQGVKMLHSRPAPCPNVRDLFTADHSLSCSLCNNGYIYYEEKEFVGAFFGNNLERRFNINGTWDLDQAQIILPVKDLAGGILDVQYFDRIVLPGVSVRYYERIEHSQSGIDRAHFRVLSIDFVIDSSGRIYRPGVDVVAEDGRLRWVSDRQPGFDLAVNRGVIYSVVYYTNPLFVVVGLPHQLRIAQTRSESGEPNVQARFPQLAVCRKDFIPFDQTDQVGPPDRPEPRSGSFT